MSVLFKWYHLCSYVCNVSNANILFLWIGNNDVLMATTGGDGTDPITPLQVWLVLGFDDI
jgi:hypothetical protein